MKETSSDSKRQCSSKEEEPIGNNPATEDLTDSESLVLDAVSSEDDQSLVLGAGPDDSDVQQSSKTSDVEAEESEERGPIGVIKDDTRSEEMKNKCTMKVRKLRSIPSR